MLGFELISRIGGVEDKGEETEAQLRSIWRVMGEKEVRVHVDLERVWDED